MGEIIDWLSKPQTNRPSPSPSLTGCIVPPATMTALASCTMLLKCTEGLRRRNRRLDTNSCPRVRKSEGRERKGGEGKEGRGGKGRDGEEKYDFILYPQQQVPLVSRTKLLCKKRQIQSAQKEVVGRKGEREGEKERRESNK